MFNPTTEQYNYLISIETHKNTAPFYKIISLTASGSIQKLIADDTCDKDIDIEKKYCKYSNNNSNLLMLIEFNKIFKNAIIIRYGCSH